MPRKGKPDLELAYSSLLLTAGDVAKSIKVVVKNRQLSQDLLSLNSLHSLRLISS